jgi:hypothetical protein
LWVDCPNKIKGAKWLTPKKVARTRSQATFRK